MEGGANEKMRDRTKDQVKDLSQEGSEAVVQPSSQARPERNLTALGTMTSQFSQNKFGQHKNDS